MVCLVTALNSIFGYMLTIELSNGGFESCQVLQMILCCVGFARSPFLLSYPPWYRLPDQRFAFEDMLKNSTVRVDIEDFVFEPMPMFVLVCCWKQAAAVAAGLSDIVPMKVRLFADSVFLHVCSWHAVIFRLALIDWQTFRTTAG